MQAPGQVLTKAFVSSVLGWYVRSCARRARTTNRQVCGRGLSERKPTKVRSCGVGNNFDLFASTYSCQLMQLASEHDSCPSWISATHIPTRLITCPC